MDDLIVVRSQVAVCEYCESYMSLWKNIRTGEYFLICEMCDNERNVKVEG